MSFVLALYQTLENLQFTVNGTCPILERKLSSGRIRCVTKSWISQPVMASLYYRHKSNPAIVCFCINLRACYPSPPLDRGRHPKDLHSINLNIVFFLLDICVPSIVPCGQNNYLIKFKLSFLLPSIKNGPCSTRSMTSDSVPNNFVRPMHRNHGPTSVFHGYLIC